MTAEEHNKTLGTLHFIYGGIHGLTLIGLLLLVVFVVFATPAAQNISTLWMIIGSLAFIALFLVVGLLPVIVGYGFRRRARWVKPAAITLAVLSLINVPIGTALGIYTIKFFRSPSGMELYGGQRSTASDSELHAAMNGAQPLMDLADRLK